MWIESHQDLEGHPKLLKLAVVLDIPLDMALGKLHRFWYWCMRYCEDGDLSKYGLEEVTKLLQINALKLAECGFIDMKPYLRVHDWWDYSGRFLRVKYKNYPETWERIKRRCKGTSKRSPRGTTKTTPKPKLPNITIPNLKDIGQTPPKPSTNGGDSPKPYLVDTPLKMVVCGFKETKGIPLDDRQWDKTHFSRNTKGAKELLTVFGETEDGAYKAIECITGIGGHLDSIECSWTLETVVKHAYDWKNGTYKMEKKR